MHKQLLWLLLGGILALGLIGAITVRPGTRYVDYWFGVEEAAGETWPSEEAFRCNALGGALVAENVTGAIDETSTVDVIYPVDDDGVVMQIGCLITTVAGFAAADVLEFAVAEFASDSSDTTLITSSTFTLDSTAAVGRFCATSTAPSTTAACSVSLNIALASDTVGIGLKVGANTANIDNDEALDATCWVTVAYPATS